MPVLLLALALAASPTASPASRVVEEIVAVVRNPASAPPRVVTLTKLTEEARIALVSRGAIGAATGPLDREALRAALEWLLDQMLVADEAGQLLMFSPAAHAVFGVTPEDLGRPLAFVLPMLPQQVQALKLRWGAGWLPGYNLPQLLRRRPSP